jgi:hypothetical protein
MKCIVGCTEGKKNAGGTRTAATTMRNARSIQRSTVKKSTKTAITIVQKCTVAADFGCAAPHHSDVPILMRMHISQTKRGLLMTGKKHMLEFYPEVIFTIPKTAGGSCCLKPIPKQTKRSRKMYRYAKHMQWEKRDEIDLVIPSKTESRVRILIKWRKFKTRIRMWRLGIEKLPALVLDGRVLFQGELNV